MHEELRRLIEERAHEIWENADRPGGRALDHWLQAELEIGRAEDGTALGPFRSPDELDQGEARMREHFSDEIAGEPLAGTEREP